MATGGGPSPSSVEDRRRSLMCSLCLDILTQPKALPCLHTFCLKCLEDLTSHQSSSTFPCPHCRSEVIVPAGGVSAFPTNLQIRLKDLDKSQGTHCPTHHEEDQDMFCTECQLSVCLKCVQSEHRQHNIQDLCDAAVAARAQLIQEKDRLLKVNMIWAEEAKQQNLLHKKTTVNSTIHNKYATMVALANKCRDERQAHVDTLFDFDHLEQRLEQALTTGTECSLVTLAKEISEDKVSAQVIEKMSAKIPTIHLVLDSSHAPDKFTGNVQDFFGVVDTVEMKLTPTEVVVKKMFSCKTEPDTEVFSLCPLDDGSVLMSYASCGLQNNTLSDKFEESGWHKCTLKGASGKCSWKSRGSGKSMFHASSSELSTFSKYKGHDNHHLRLGNKRQGEARIIRVKVISVEPFDIERVTVFKINVGPHRAFDVDSSEQFFAVVEEPKVSGGQRKVRLYQRNQPDAIATYTPPSKPFNPADVCFFTLGGKEVLTIADEVGDSVHVVHVQAGGLTFVRHLAPGCSLLVQPTALNTEHRGQLWVACRGGAILTMTPFRS